jgi:N-acetylglucosaminyldiphosphoundecaprenol N-acetyl-beta-D-mannosaminyltransferase
MIDMVFPRRRVSRPLYLTSANGEVLARCSTEPMTDRPFRAADLINADGQPLVTVSRFKSSNPLPERVATTDLFHVVARKAQAAGLTFYMFGADEAENEAAVANVQRMYPDLKIVGHSHGYLRGEARKVGLEWAWRVWLEPRRLAWRYLTTNPRALYLLFNKSQSTPTRRD